MKQARYKLIALLLPIVMLASCIKEKGHVVPHLSISQTELLYSVDGGSAEITITSNTDWHISGYGSPWLQYSPASGSKGTTKVTVTAAANATNDLRSATFSITATNSAAYRIVARQSGRNRYYPNYNPSPAPPDPTGMGSTATQLAAKFKLGWNIGNTMEAIGGETNWGNPLITENYIKFVKQQGFNAIRIPCSWDQYTNQTTAKIQDSWLNRVKEVVQYCVKNDVYVLLNVHWDGGWLENNINPLKKDSVVAKQKALWEQIATALRDFDEHLLFASANEPAVQTGTEMGVLLSYHQAFVDAVRSTGGRNTYRVIVVQGPSTDIDKTDALMTALPADPIPNRMMTEVHFYAPYQFCIMPQDESWGNVFYYWGAGYHSTLEPTRNATHSEEDYVTAEFQKMKAKFADKGIPVILGEYGAYRRTAPLDTEKHQASIDHWITFVTKQAIANGLKPFWWDTGGALDRAGNTVRDPRTINALIAGGQ
jgi:endoglucanase